MGASAGMFGAGYSAMSSISAGKYAKQVAEINAQVGEIQAQDALGRGENAVVKHAMGVRTLVGAQRASLSAQGQDVNDPSTSAVDVQADAAYLSKLDQVTIRNNAAREAWGYRVQAQNAKMQGSIAETSAFNKATETLIGGAAGYWKTKYGFGRD
jgi:hypothetical protein